MSRDRAGYYRHPHVNRDRVVFVAEDDLWSVALSGGVAVRLTANPGSHTAPRFSPDGSTLAFVSNDEGRPDVHLMDADGGPSRRLTFFGSSTRVVEWRPDGEAVVVATDHRQPFRGWAHLWDVPVDGTAPRPIPVGPAWSVSFGSKGMVVGRNTFDPARWKRYRGGRSGSLWIDRTGSGGFEELIDLPGNLAYPMWIGRRIYFLSDHEGVGNLYSVTPGGRSIVRHTDHEDFYVRYPSTDGTTVVYHCGADLWSFDPRSGEHRPVEVELHSARPQRNRRFMGPSRYLETVSLHPRGHSVAVTARGDVQTMPLWEGVPADHGAGSRHRRRLAAWLAERREGGDRLVMVGDDTGEERLMVVDAVAGGAWRTVDRDVGRVRSVDPAPAGRDLVAVTNHRHELILVDLERGNARVIHRSPHTWIGGTSWSSDGRWLAFAAATTRTTMNLHLYDTRNRRTTVVGEPRFVDHSPSFDPEGKYLVYLSSRVFEPVADSVFHDLGFPRSTVPMVVTLRVDVADPFSTAGRAPRAPGAPLEKPDDATNGKEAAKKGGENGPDPVEIDLEGIDRRTLAFPVPAGRYSRPAAVRGRVLWLSWPVAQGAGERKAQLQAWDWSTDKLDQVADGVEGVTASADGKVMAVRFGRKLRVVPVGWKDDKNGKDTPGRETGWVDLERIRLEVTPGDEWQQMFEEAWRLQRDHYWFEDMGGVDWAEVLARYRRLVDRVASRAEFSDLLWEMQGELGTSHAYELGGDYRPEPAWTLGKLGADLEYRRAAWRVARIPIGDPWASASAAPLAAPGVDIRPGDRILAVDGRELSATVGPSSLLVERADRPVELRVARGRSRPRTVVVTPLASEQLLRYRDWVEVNRSKVAELSGGRVGYIHIPDMMAWGFSEFHRGWRSDLDLDGLVIDVRFNGGGNVSQLLLQKLVRRRLGYRVTRWRDPVGFPYDSPAGPMVCVTNENAGSDGDIFSHTFKQLGLGPLVGTRTWGGVVGIWPQQSLVDGTVTTQPEFGTWFTDVGYAVENFGTEPDIEVVLTPDDYAAGRDRQLEVAVAEVMKIVEAHPGRPDFGAPPSVRPPRLPAADR